VAGIPIPAGSVSRFGEDNMLFLHANAWLLPGILMMFASIGVVLLFDELRKALFRRRIEGNRSGFHRTKDKFRKAS
jgi:hypothetical protein